MSILIPDMKMPDKATTIVIFSEGKARVFRQDIDHDEWLTAIEVPPHGRLIDADELSKKLTELADCKWNQMAKTLWSDAYEEVNGFVEDAPTIIGAEG